jgi:hypothetical protein
MIVYAKQLTLECDADFGKFSPSDVVAFKVLIYRPCNQYGKIEKKEIMLVVPKLANYDEELDIAHKVMQLFCEDGDNYQLIKFSNDDMKSFHSAKPVIGFDPSMWESSEILGFFWLVPPLDLRH